MIDGILVDPLFLLVDQGKNKKQKKKKKEALLAVQGWLSVFA